MSIDGIGRPPVPPVSGSSTEGASAPAGGGATFQVERRAEVEATSGSGLLDRLERGELSVDQYLDGRVDEALAPFENKLPAEKLEFMRSALRAELETDPVLVELVRRATEGVPAR
jgi:hypothetical protein